MEDITAKTIISILLNTPEDLEYKEKVSGTRKNFVCTFNEAVVPMESSKADGNGSYLSTGCLKRFYFTNDNNCTLAHFNSDLNHYYINERLGAKYCKKEVKPESVYELVRSYRQNKDNKTFMQMLATARRVDQSEILPFYFMSYRWIDGVEKEFVVSRHGNAKHPHTGVYHRHDFEIKNKVVEKLKSGCSSGKAYRDVIKEAEVQLFCLQKY